MAVSFTVIDWIGDMLLRVGTAFGLERSAAVPAAVDELTLSFPIIGTASFVKAGCFCKAPLLSVEPGAGTNIFLAAGWDDCLSQRMGVL